MVLKAAEKQKFVALKAAEMTGILFQKTPI